MMIGTMVSHDVGENPSQRDVSIESSLKVLELEDSDEETMIQELQGDEYDMSDDDGVYIAWENKNLGSGTECGSKPGDPLLEDENVQRLKAMGTDCFKDKKYQDALKWYMDAIEIAGGIDETIQPTKAVLLSNVSATLLALHRTQEAIKYGSMAHKANPNWSKPFFRLARAYLAMGDYGAAVEACQQGEALCKSSYTGTTEFTPLYDEIVIHGSAMGHDRVLFTGRRLEVRSAGEDAWLGKPAPHIPELDGPLDESTALPSDDVDTIRLHDSKGISSQTPELDGRLPSSRGDQLAEWNFAESQLAMQAHRTSFRCIKEAYEASKDGDRIVLLRGTHNGMGETVCIKKRVLIEGEGQLGETVIDQRANSPTFKIERGGVILRNLEIDHTGFREAILIDGNEHVNPLIENCEIKCSGDDSLHSGGKSRPIIRYCRFKAKKCGIRTFDSSRITLDRCIIEDCGAQGIEIMDESRLAGQRCLIQKCAEDGIVVMSDAKCSLIESRVVDNKGPGIDCSGNAFAALSRCEVLNNTAGCWSWDSSSILANGCRLAGGSSHIILIHSNGKVDTRSCEITGAIHAPEKAWNEGLLNRGNTFNDPEQPVDFPIESGPFVFIPSPYTSI